MTTRKTPKHYGKLGGIHDTRYQEEPDEVTEIVTCSN